MDRYLGGEEIDVKTLVDDLERAVARGTSTPCWPPRPPPRAPGRASARVELLELVTGGFPTPLERDGAAVTTPDGRRARR